MVIIPSGFESAAAASVEQATTATAEASRNTGSTKGSEDHESSGEQRAEAARLPSGPGNTDSNAKVGVPSRSWTALLRHDVLLVARSTVSE